MKAREADRTAMNAGRVMSANLRVLKRVVSVNRIVNRKVRQIEKKEQLIRVGRDEAPV